MGCHRQVVRCRSTLVIVVPTGSHWVSNIQRSTRTRNKSSHSRGTFDKKKKKKNATATVNRRASLISLVVKAIEASRGLVPRSCVQDLLGVHIPDMSKIMDKNICMGLRAFQGIGSLP